jgi:EmrB/QacA subfamily drug resistance transporter
MIRTMSQDTGQPSVVLTKRRRWAVTAGLLLGIFLAALEATVVSTAMPTVVASLGGLNSYSWVFSAYLLTSTASVPLWGRLSDLYGRRGIYLTAIALFLTGSMLAGVSQSMLQLVLFRAVQGLGAGGLIPLALTIIGEIYTLAERTRMQAVFSSVWGVSSIVGPLVGGFITDTISWRWVFYLNLPIGLVAAFIVQRTLPEHVSVRRVVVDWPGGLLLFLSTTLLLVALSEVSLVWALIAVASVVAFVYVERTVSDPIVPFALFRNRTVTVATLVGFLAGTALYGAIAFIPLLIQVTTGGSATSAGQILTPIYLMWVLASIVAARILLRVGARAATVVGTTAVFVSFTALPWLAVGSSRTSVFADMGLMGAGLGFSMLSLLLAVQHSVLRTELGVATSLNMFARSIGGAVGVAIMGAILAAGLGGSPRITPGALEGISLATLSPELRQRLIVSLQRAFATGAVATGFALVVSFWVPPLVGGARSDAGEMMLDAEMAILEPEAESVGVND